MPDTARITRDELILFAGLALDAAETCAKMHLALMGAVEAYGEVADTLTALLAQEDAS